MRCDRRKAAWLLAALALLFVLFGVIFPAACCCHMCLGDHCPVCLQLRMWGTVLRVLGAALLLYALPAEAALLAARSCFALLCPRACVTPVLLKTKLLN